MKEERQDLHTPFQQMNKQLSQLLHIHLSLLYKDFPSHFKLNKGKSLEIYCQWRWIILSIRLLTIRMERVIDINSSLFANCCSCTFFCSLIDRCQNVTYIKSVSKFAWKPFKLQKKKVSVMPLFNSSYLCFTVYLLKSCSVHGKSCCNYSPKSFPIFSASISSSWGNK